MKMYGFAVLACVVLAGVTGCQSGSPCSTCGKSSHKMISSETTASAAMYLTTDQGPGTCVGTVAFTDTSNGLRIDTDLTGLPPGEHGFHVHEKADCSPMEKEGHMNHALAAGGHYDPDKTGKHLGPDGGGHKGDLPRLIVDAQGNAKTTMWLKNAKAADFKQRSLMIHAGGDNYSDTPVTLGGGGARIACGIIE